MDMTTIVTLVTIIFSSLLMWSILYPAYLYYFKHIKEGAHFYCGIPYTIGICHCNFSGMCIRNYE